MAGKGNFETEYKRWMKEHISRSTGERRRRLEEGRFHSEKEFLKNVWWPAVGNFEHLHPEYEVIDFNGGRRFIDLAYIRMYYKIAWEILGFGPHWANIDRWKFGDDWARHCDLTNAGWTIMYFSYDYVDKKAHLCQRTVHQTMGRLFGTEADYYEKLNLTSYEEKLVRKMKQHEIVRISPPKASEIIGLENKAARKVLKSLTDKGILMPDNNSTRIRSYELTKDLSKFV